jgi:uncharacterized protein (DUF4415 family)
MSKKLNPEKVDQDNPEWSQEDAKNALPASDALTQIFNAETAERLLRPRGRPRMAFPKQRINIRLSHEVIEHFKAEGEGWQTRIDAALRQFIEEHPDSR